MHRLNQCNHSLKEFAGEKYKNENFEKRIEIMLKDLTSTNIGAQSVNIFGFCSVSKPLNKHGQ